MANQIDNIEERLAKQFEVIANATEENIQHEVLKGETMVTLSDQILKLNLLKLKALEMANKGSLGVGQLNKIYSLPTGKE